MTVLDRANRALAASLFDVDPLEPYAASILRARRGRGAMGAMVDARPLLAHWESVHPGSPVGDLRYRWVVSHKHLEAPRWAGPPQEWTAWRPAERAAMGDPFEFETRLSIPAIVTDCGELLAELADDTDAEVAARATRMLAEAEPIMRREFAAFVRALHSWTDTFALWCLGRRPRLFERLQPMALAIATSYAATASAEGGIVRGTRFPFHEKPLVSGSAQLASALLALGAELPLVGSLVDFVTRERDPGGGWGDAGGPADVLTTLVAFDLLLQVDPAFDPRATIAFLGSRQRDDGTWRCYGPEVPWLTAAIADTLAAARQPFGARFRWPHAPPANRDHKTRLPVYAWFDLVARLFAALPGLGAADVELAFLDLVGFRAFNNARGQDAGDAVLAEFGSRLAGIPGAVAIRDGGDEFLVVGAPAGGGLARDLDLFRHDWPAQFRARFGADVPPVSARILVTKTSAAGLLQGRETLGRTIGTLKSREKPGPEGLLVSI